ncbi:protein BTG3-like [Antennarius striatus]|uniref:protein BTG3-like n=1 Tax=Antennarius striatus TaxID=241820 RepID=UPI0035B46BC0
MKAEIAAAVWFLRNLVERAHRKPEPHKLDLFCEKLASALQKKFEGHWYPENPSKGQAFRSIRVNQFSGPDPDVLWSCQESGIESGEMIMPPELTLWVDPGEVWCRIGERNYHFLATRLSSSEQEHKVTAKMTSFKDKVMSHSHSAPSSDVERCYSSPLTVSSTDRKIHHMFLYGCLQD